MSALCIVKSCPCTSFRQVFDLLAMHQLDACDLWMDEIPWQHLETMVETITFVGIYFGESNQKPGFPNGGAKQHMSGGSVVLRVAPFCFIFSVRFAT